MWLTFKNLPMQCNRDQNGWFLNDRESIAIGGSISSHWRELDSAAGADQSFSPEEEASLFLSKGFVYVTL